MAVYLDLAVILNFLVDFLLLLGTNRISGFPADAGRCAAAAAVGAVYSGMCLLRRFRFLGNLIWRVAVLILLGLIAFGCDRSAVKRGGVFLLLSLALGGAAVSFGRGDWRVLAFSAAGIWLLCLVAFGESIGGRTYVPVTITYGGRTVSMIALRDTGNTLTDPVTGEQVLVIGPDIAGKLTGLTREQLAAPLETLSRRTLPGLRLIPYHAVGQSGGMLLGLRFPNVKIDSREQSAVVAFAPGGLGSGELYQALTGGV